MLRVLPTRLRQDISRFIDTWKQCIRFVPHHTSRPVHIIFQNGFLSRSRQAAAHERGVPKSTWLEPWGHSVEAFHCCSTCLSSRTSLLSSASFTSAQMIYCSLISTSTLVHWKHHTLFVWSKRNMLTDRRDITHFRNDILQCYPLILGKN